MGKEGGVNRRFVGRAVAVVLALTVGGVACSSGGDKTKASGSSSAPEDHRTSAAEVSAGLGKINSIAGQVALAASADAKAAKDLDAGIEPAWQAVEGTVRANDKDVYIRFEDDFAALTKAAAAGDGPRAQQASADIADAVKAYLAKFPG
jgi:hypothetical protein